MPALGSATHGSSIMDLRHPWGRPRFHLPGQHPATYRMREHRRMVAELNDRCPTRNGFELLDYLDRKLVEFEAGEDEAKRIAWARLLDREPTGESPLSGRAGESSDLSGRGRTCRGIAPPASPVAAVAWDQPHSGNAR